MAKRPTPEERRTRHLYLFRGALEHAARVRRRRRDAADDHARAPRRDARAARGAPAPPFRSCGDEEDGRRERRRCVLVLVLKRARHSCGDDEEDGHRAAPLRLVVLVWLRQEEELPPSHEPRRAAASGAVRPFATTVTTERRNLVARGEGHTSARLTLPRRSAQSLVTHLLRATRGAPRRRRGRRRTRAALHWRRDGRRRAAVRPLRHRAAGESSRVLLFPRLPNWWYRHLAQGSLCKNVACRCSTCSSRRAATSSAQSASRPRPRHARSTRAARRSPTLTTT